MRWESLLWRRIICPSLRRLILAYDWILRFSGDEVRKIEKMTRDPLARPTLFFYLSITGIIQICSYCHSVRDTKGTWETLQTYLAKHSEAEVSHGICPHCLPGVLETIQRKDGFAGES